MWRWKKNPDGQVVQVVAAEAIPMTDAVPPENEPVLQPKEDLIECGRKVIHMASLRGKFAFARAMIDEAERISMSVRVEFGLPPDQDLLTAYAETVRAAISEMEQALSLCKLNLAKISPEVM